MAQSSACSRTLAFEGVLYGSAVCVYAFRQGRRIFAQVLHRASRGYIGLQGQLKEALISVKRPVQAPTLSRLQLIAKRRAAVPGVFRNVGGSSVRSPRLRSAQAELSRACGFSKQRFLGLKGFRV